MMYIINQMIPSIPITDIGTPNKPYRTDIEYIQDGYSVDTGRIQKNVVLDIH